jgi:anti-sigma factor RsiW
MTVLFLSVFILGLVLGVFSMIAGIEGERRHGRWVKYLNIPTASAAATLFGLVGYPLAKYTSLRSSALVAIAIAAAAAGAMLMLAVIAGWAVPSAAKDVPDERYLLQGHLARVTRSIESATSGEIAYEHEGQRQIAHAASLDGTPIALDCDVVIERVEDGIAYVQRWSTIARQLELPS